MDREILGAAMEEEMKKFLKEEMPSHIMGTIYSLCKECSSIKAKTSAVTCYTVSYYTHFTYFFKNEFNLPAIRHNKTLMPTI